MAGVGLVVVLKAVLDLVGLGRPATLAGRRWQVYGIWVEANGDGIGGLAGEGSF